MPTVPAAYGHGHPHVMPVGVAPAVSPMTAQPVMAAPAAPARPDPIAQTPAAAWHICTPGGDQYGPVMGDVLRQWVVDRRVTPDSLLWREGWSDWQRADAVLVEFTPQIAPPVALPAAGPMNFAGPMPVAGPAVDIPFPSESARMISRRAYGRRSRNTQAVIIALLVVALLILAPLLGYVLYQQL
jgi:hypothetical protein